MIYFFLKKTSRTNKFKFLKEKIFMGYKLAWEMRKDGETVCNI